MIGVFLDDFTRRSYGFVEMAHYQGEDLDSFIHDRDEKDAGTRAESIDAFEKACSSAGISYSVQRDRNVALQALLHESVYGDRLMVGAAETLTRYEENLPTRFLRDVLNDVQCPIAAMIIKRKRKLQGHRLIR